MNAHHCALTIIIYKILLNKVIRILYYNISTTYWTNLICIQTRKLSIYQKMMITTTHEYLEIEKFHIPIEKEKEYIS